MGLAPSTSDGVVKLRDQVTDSEKWFTTSEIDGSPAMKLDLSLTRPIIIMPRRTDSLEYALVLFFSCPDRHRLISITFSLCLEHWLILKFIYMMLQLPAA